jgi:hypothetical protein
VKTQSGTTTTLLYLGPSFLTGWLFQHDVFVECLVVDFDPDCCHSVTLGGRGPFAVKQGVRLVNEFGDHWHCYSPQSKGSEDRNQL